jgi:hypothetical protein
MTTFEAILGCGYVQVPQRRIRRKTLFYESDDLML